MVDDINDDVTLKSIIAKLKEWILVLRSQWLIIFLAGVIGGVFALYKNYSIPPVYTAELSFAMEDENGGGSKGGFGGIASQFGIDLGGSAGGAFSGNNLPELMKSRSLVEKVLLSNIEIKNQTTTLLDYYLDFSGIKNSWAKKKGFAERFLRISTPQSPNIERDSVITDIYNTIIDFNLAITQKDKKISITNIIVKSENELFAKFFAEKLVNVISEFYTEIKTKKSNKNIQILQKQTDSIRQQLNAAITGVALTNDNVYNLNPAFNIKRVPSSVKQIDVQANTAMLVQLVQNLETSKMSLMRETPLIQVIDKPILPLPEKKVSLLMPVLLGSVIGIVLLVFSLLIRFEYKRLK